MRPYMSQRKGIHGRICIIHNKGWDPFDLFNPATFVCLFQSSTWISNIALHSRFLCSAILDERWLNVCFVDIDRIVEHHCLTFLLINQNLNLAILLLSIEAESCCEVYSIHYYVNIHIWPAQYVRLVGCIMTRSNDILKYILLCPLVIRAVQFKNNYLSIKVLHFEIDWSTVVSFLTSTNGSYTKVSSMDVMCSLMKQL